MQQKRQQEAFRRGEKKAARVGPPKQKNSMTRRGLPLSICYR
jgi:hypothetical protein